jgi:diguanylate cyclase (GGDEF)-like protein
MSDITAERKEKLSEAAFGTLDTQPNGIRVCTAAIAEVYDMPEPETLLPAAFHGRYESGVLTKFGQEVLIAAEYKASNTPGDEVPDNVYSFVSQHRPRPGVDIEEVASHVQALFNRSKGRLRYDRSRFYDAVSIDGKDIVITLKGFEVRDENDIDVIAPIIAQIIDSRLKGADLACHFEQGLSSIASAPARQLDVDRFRRLVEDTNLNEEAVRLAAAVDAHTNLLNRHGMYQKLEQVYEALPEDDSQYVMTIFTDGDGFKEVNDRYGHSEGDKVISSLARKVAAFQVEFASAFNAYAMGMQVVIGRYGGDEFVITLAGLPLCGNEDVICEMRNFAVRYFKNEAMEEYGVRSQRVRIRDSANGEGIFHSPTSTIGICLQTNREAKESGYLRAVHLSDTEMNALKAATRHRRLGEQMIQHSSTYTIPIGVQVAEQAGVKDASEPYEHTRSGA